MVDAAAAALLTEHRVFGPSVPLTEAAPVGTGKALLARSTAEVSTTSARLILGPVVTERDWSAYTEQRIRVEAEFGIDASGARASVRDLRDRVLDLGLALYTAQEGDRVVGAIARFRLTAPHRHVARLQEVDIFPMSRGRGHGNAMLSTMLELVASEGVTLVVVGADEDDWPLNWYRRHGFHDVARVPLTR